MSDPAQLTLLVISPGSPAPHPSAPFAPGILLSYHRHIALPVAPCPSFVLLQARVEDAYLCSFIPFSKFISLWLLNSITVFQTTVLWPNDDRLNCSSQRFLALLGRAAPQCLLQKHRSRCWSSDLDQSCVTYFVWWFSSSCHIQSSLWLGALQVCLCSVLTNLLMSPGWLSALSCLVIWELSCDPREILSCRRVMTRGIVRN